MNATMILIIVVPVIIILSVLYAIGAEMRHNRVRRSRWDVRDNDGSDNGGRDNSTVLQLAGRD